MKAALRLDYLLAALFMGAMALIAFVNILGRYLFHYSLSFTEEITIHLFVWVTIVGSGIAFERGGQLGMVTLFRRLPAAAQTGLRFFSAGVSALLFIAVDILLVRSIYMEITVFHARSPALGIPLWIYYAGVPALSVFVFRGIWRGAQSATHNPQRESNY